MPTTTNVQQVKLNIMTSSQYNSATKNANELYILTDATIDYNDLSNKPTIGDATLTIQKNGTQVATFTANSSTNQTANITVPTDTGDLTNGAGFITGITSGDVTTALGYTPYNSSNPNGYTSNVGTVTSVNNTSPDGSGNVSLTIPTVNNATLTITQGGTTKGTFTANASSDVTIDIDAGGGSSLPDMTGNAHKLLSNDGTNALWMAKDYYRSLTSAQATTLLSDGTYNGENVTDGAIFVCDDGSIKEFNVEYLNPSLTWELTPKPNTSSDFRQSACYNPDKDEIVVYNFASNTSKIYKSSDKGQNWTLMYTFSGTIDSSNQINQIFYCNGYYILLRWGYGIYYSTDLTNWTEVSSSAFSSVSNSNEMKLTYFNGTYFFTYGTSANCITSTDLTNWTNTSLSHYSLAVGNGVITDGWKTSTDGTTWNSTTSNTSELIWLIYVPNYNNGSFIGFKRNSSTIYVSNDNFETVSTITPTGLSNFNTNSLIAYNNGLFVVSQGSSVYYSTDLTNWTSSTTASSATRLNALFADNDGYWYYSKWSSSGTSDNFHKGTYSITINRSLEQLSYTKSEADSAFKLPVGVVVSILSNTIPDGWLACDGSAISRTTYADLFSVIGTTYGSGDGSTTFNLPSLSGGEALIGGSSAYLGDTSNGVLPNITGEISSVAYGTQSNGALQIASLGSYQQAGSTGSLMGATTIKFDASKSSNFYTDGVNYVRAKSIVTRFIIKY